MTYELAKQLKDVGFPQPDKYDPGESGIGYDTSGKKVYYDNCCSFWRGDDDRPDAYLPTLSELIRACGKDFYTLGCSDGTWWAAEWKEPFAPTFPRRFDGSTPDEAVAHLWLSLRGVERGEAPSDKKQSKSNPHP